MKKKLLCAGLLLMVMGAGAQQNKNAARSRTAPQQKPPASVRLQSTGTYPAKAGGKQGIADPTIKALNNMGDEGSPRLYGSNGVLGLPRGTYGFARGQLWLRSNGATSIGGITGNPSVGTGSSSSGAGGNTLGLNGQSPYAGPSIWGSAQGIRQPDSVLRRSRQIGIRQ